MEKIVIILRIAQFCIPLGMFRSVEKRTILKPVFHQKCNPTTHK